MTLTGFKDTVKGQEPCELAAPLRALWWAARGDWVRAHDLAQEIDTPTGAWIHAHLHRQEGDLSNAGYWYARAGKPEFKGSIETEWDEIAGTLLAAGDGIRE